MSAKSMSSPQPCRAAHRWCHSADCCVHSGRFRRKNLRHAKRPPCWVVFCVVETTGTITPISPHFTHYLRLLKNRTTMRFFALFVSARASAKIQIFRKFVYGSTGRDTPAHRFFNTTPICSRRTRCTARGVPSSACPERRRRLPSSSFAPWKARPCCPLCPCPM